MVFAAALSLASCATFQRWGDEGAVKQVAQNINAGKAQALAAMSVTPFLVDGEIVPIAADVSDFWNGIVKAGFRVDGAALDQGATVGPEATNSSRQPWKSKPSSPGTSRAAPVSWSSPRGPARHPPPHEKRLVLLEDRRVQGALLK